MKKILLTILISFFCVFSVYAQDEVKPKIFIPQEGDISLGFDAAPILNYLGNMFNGNTSNKIQPIGGEPFTSSYDFFDQDLMPDVSIIGKYFLTDEVALRANIGLMIGNHNYKSYVVDDKSLALDPFSEAKLIDQVNYNKYGASIMFGAEYRVGKKRVQGVFGGGLLFALTKQSANYTWGNQITSINQRPSTSYPSILTIPDGYRPLSDYSETPIFYGGLNLSAGVEFFVAQKISLGVEVNLCGYYVWSSQTYVLSEGYNVISKKVDQRTDTLAPASTAFILGTQSLGGALSMNFYF